MDDVKLIDDQTNIELNKQDMINRSSNLSIIYSQKLLHKKTSVLSSSNPKQSSDNIRRSAFSINASQKQNILVSSSNVLDSSSDNLSEQDLKMPEKLKNSSTEIRK